MNRMAPLTKLILTVAISAWAILLGSPAALGLLVAGQVLLAVVSGVWQKTYKAVCGLAVFAVLLAAIQYLFGSSAAVSVASGLKMMAMTLVFVLVLATTRIQDLTASLVGQLHIPHEYAFMFTAALRFIPDFLAESKAVQEAQACRGYAARGNIVKRISGYMAIVEPLVLKAVSRSETMAMSLELRGFGGRSRCHSIANIALQGGDYAALAGMAAVTVLLIMFQLHASWVL